MEQTRISPMPFIEPSQVQKIQLIQGQVMVLHSIENKKKINQEKEIIPQEQAQCQKNEDQASQGCIR